MVRLAQFMLPELPLHAEVDLTLELCLHQRAMRMNLNPPIIGLKELTPNEGTQPVVLSSAVFIGNSDASHGESLYIKQ